MEIPSSSGENDLLQVVDTIDSAVTALIQTSGATAKCNCSATIRASEKLVRQLREELVTCKAKLYDAREVDKELAKYKRKAVKLQHQVDELQLTQGTTMAATDDSEKEELRRQVSELLLMKSAKEDECTQLRADLNSMKSQVAAASEKHVAITRKCEALKGQLSAAVKKVSQLELAATTGGMLGGTMRPEGTDTNNKQLAANDTEGRESGERLKEAERQVEERDDEIADLKEKLDTARAKMIRQAAERARRKESWDTELAEVRQKLAQCREAYDRDRADWEAVRRYLQEKAGRLVEQWCEVDRQLQMAQAALAGTAGAAQSGQTRKGHGKQDAYIELLEADNRILSRRCREYDAEVNQLRGEPDRCPRSVPVTVAVPQEDVRNISHQLLPPPRSDCAVCAQVRVMVGERDQYITLMRKEVGAKNREIHALKGRLEAEGQTQKTLYDALKEAFDKQKAQLVKLQSEAQMQGTPGHESDATLKAKVQGLEHALVKAWGTVDQEREVASKLKAQLETQEVFWAKRRAEDQKKHETVQSEHLEALKEQRRVVAARDAQITQQEGRNKELFDARASLEVQCDVLEQELRSLQRRKVDTCEQSVQVSLPGVAQMVATVSSGGKVTAGCGICGILEKSIVQRNTELDMLRKQLADKNRLLQTMQLRERGTSDNLPPDTLAADAEDLSFAEQVGAYEQERSMGREQPALFKALFTYAAAALNYPLSEAKTRGSLRAELTAAWRAITNPGNGALISTLEKGLAQVSAKAPALASPETVAAVRWLMAAVQATAGSLRAVSATWAARLVSCAATVKDRGGSPLEVECAVVCAYYDDLLSEYSNPSALAPPPTVPGGTPPAVALVPPLPPTAAPPLPPRAPSVPPPDSSNSSAAAVMLPASGAAMSLTLAVSVMRQSGEDVDCLSEGEVQEDERGEGVDRNATDELLTQTSKSRQQPGEVTHTIADPRVADGGGEQPPGKAAGDEAPAQATAASISSQPLTTAAAETRESMSTVSTERAPTGLAVTANLGPSSASVLGKRPLANHNPASVEERTFYTVRLICADGQLNAADARNLTSDIGPVKELWRISGSVFAVEYVSAQKAREAVRRLDGSKFGGYALNCVPCEETETVRSAEEEACMVVISHATLPREELSKELGRFGVVLAMLSMGNEYLAVFAGEGEAARAAPTLNGLRLQGSVVRCRALAELSIAEKQTLRDLTGGLRVAALVALGSSARPAASAPPPVRAAPAGVVRGSDLRLQDPVLDRGRRRERSGSRSSSRRSSSSSSSTDCYSWSASSDSRDGRRGFTSPPARQRPVLQDPVLADKPRPALQRVVQRGPIRPPGRREENALPGRGSEAVERYCTFCEQLGKPYHVCTSHYSCEHKGPRPQTLRSPSKPRVTGQAASSVSDAQGGSADAVVELPQLGPLSTRR